MIEKSLIEDADISRIIRPVFIQEEGNMFDHTASNKNASVFFFKLEGRVFACTCGHVIKKDEDTNDLESIYLRSENKTQVLGYMSCDTSPPISNRGFHFAHTSYGSDIDLAFLYIKDCSMLDFIKSEYIILDFDTPEHKITEFSEFYAFGWGNDHKEETIDTVRTPQIRCTVPPSTLKLSDIGLSFHAVFDSNHNFSLSGMSGGLIMGRIGDSDKLAPVGIIYEGSPTEEGKKDINSLFNQPNMLHLYCYRLSSNFLKECLKGYDLSVIDKESYYPCLSYNLIDRGDKKQLIVVSPILSNIKQ